MIIFFVLPAAVAAALQVLWIRMMQNPAYCYNEDSIHYCYNEDSIQNRIAYFFFDNFRCRSPYCISWQKQDRQADCLQEVTDYANPLNGSCDVPDGPLRGLQNLGNEAVLESNQDDASAQTLILHFLHIASQILAMLFSRRPGKRIGRKQVTGIQQGIVLWQWPVLPLALLQSVLVRADDGGDPSRRPESRSQDLLHAPGLVTVALGSRQPVGSPYSGSGGEQCKK